MAVVRTVTNDPNSYLHEGKELTLSRVISTTPPTIDPNYIPPTVPSDGSVDNTNRDTNISYDNGSEIKYAILIPKKLVLTGERASDKLTIEIDGDSPFVIDKGGKINVAVDKTTDVLVNGSDKVIYILTETATATTEIENELLVFFSNSTDNPKDVYVYFDKTKPIFTGEYSDIIHFFAPCRARNRRKS
jgi:hypothetical protein